MRRHVLAEPLRRLPHLLRLQQGPAQRHQHILSLRKPLRRQPQVLIEAALVELQTGDLTNLGAWRTSTDAPAVVASDGDYEVVEVPYPLFINGRKAGYFKVDVSRAP